MFGENWDVVNNNGWNNRDQYPTGRGATLGQRVTGSAPASPMSGGGPDSNDEVARALEIGGQVNPMIGGAIFIALVFGIMFAARWAGSTDEFKAIKPSVYNVLIIALAAAAGSPIVKYFFVKVPLPGISKYVLAG